MTNKLASYKDFEGEYYYDPDASIFFGTVTAFPTSVKAGVVTFQSDRENETETEFHDSVDDFLSFIEELKAT